MILDKKNEYVTNLVQKINKEKDLFETNSLAKLKSELNAVNGGNNIESIEKRNKFIFKLFEKSYI